MNKIGILGSGIVAKTLAMGFEKHGYKVMMGSRDTSKLIEWAKESGFNGEFASLDDTAAFGELLVYAVKGTVAKSALASINPEYLKGKVIIDANNPIADAMPENGVLKYYTDINYSLMEELQKDYPEAKFVKAFSSVGNALMINPDFGVTKPTMFICGNDEEAKKEVIAILDKFGWEAEDMGSAVSARAIEPLAMLWCIPGFAKNQWSHAFKLLK